MSDTSCGLWRHGINQSRTAENLARFVRLTIRSNSRCQHWSRIIHWKHCSHDSCGIGGQGQHESALQELDLLLPWKFGRLHVHGLGNECQWTHWDFQSSNGCCNCQDIFDICSGWVAFGNCYIFFQVRVSTVFLILFCVQYQAFLRGIFANWLVCLAVWLASATSSMSGKLLSIITVISAFVAMGFEHSVANMFFIPFGLWFANSGLTFGVFWQFVSTNLIPVTLGNIVGGAFCVAALSSFFYGKLGE